MVAISAGGLYNGTTMEEVSANYYHNIKETYGVPLYTVHRVDLHNQLRLLATQEDGPGYPVDLQVRADVVDYVSLFNLKRGPTEPRFSLLFRAF